MKRILIVTQYIYPEPFKSSEMAFELAARGYKVDVLTGIPNYPEGHYYDGYGIFRKRRENVRNVTFYRCLQTPRKMLPGFLGLSVNYLTFAVNATFWVIFFFLWKKRYDAIIAHEPSPITQIIPACVLGDLKRIPVFSWIQDIWPDSVISSLKNKHVVIEYFLSAITDWVYRHSTKLLISSKGMASLINRDENYSDKIIYFPQWSEDYYKWKDNKSLLKEYGVDTDAYLIMMAGNIADGIGIPAVMNFCKEMSRQDDISIIFVGGGAGEETLRGFVYTEGLKNVYFTGRRPSSELPDLYAETDAMLLSLKKTELPHLKATVPARLQGYMSAGKPIFAMIEGCAAEMIISSDCGFVVPSGDSAGLSKIVSSKVLTDRENLLEKGINGRRFYEHYFTKERCLTNLEDIINGKKTTYPTPEI